MLHRVFLLCSLLSAAVSPMAVSTSKDSSSVWKADNSYCSKNWGIVIELSKRLRNVSERILPQTVSPATKPTGTRKPLSFLCVICHSLLPGSLLPWADTSRVFLFERHLIQWFCGVKICYQILRVEETKLIESYNRNIHVCTSKNHLYSHLCMP